MLRRYIPGKGYVNLGVKDNKVKIIKSYSTIGGLCDLGSYGWTSKLSCCEPPINNCYSFPNLDGGSPSSIPQLFMDGGNPFASPICFINGGTFSNNCVSGPLDGLTPTGSPSQFINGGTPNSNPLCFIDGRNP